MRDVHWPILESVFRGTSYGRSELQEIVELIEDAGLEIVGRSDLRTPGDKFVQQTRAMHKIRDLVARSGDVDTLTDVEAAGRVEHYTTEDRLVRQVAQEHDVRPPTDGIRLSLLVRRLIRKVAQDGAAQAAVHAKEVFDAETVPQSTMYEDKLQTPVPTRGDVVESWLVAERDRQEDPDDRTTVNHLLIDLRERADIGARYDDVLDHSGGQPVIIGVTGVNQAVIDSLVETLLPIVGPEDAYSAAIAAVRNGWRPQFAVEYAPEDEE